MITIFSTPRPFQGPLDVIQQNAIKSWTLLKPQCEIILFEDEKGTTSKIAKEFGVHCLTDVKCNEFGTPLLNDVFKKVQKMATNEIIVQVNTDIILMGDLLEAVRKIERAMGDSPFFMVGRRWDLDIKEPVRFDESGWQEELRQKVAREGKLHGLSGLDYWVFPRNLKVNPPPFVIGRPGMDSWLIYKVRSLKIPLIDATEVILAVHQNHNYPKKKENYFEIEKRKNFRLAGGSLNMMNLRDANWVFTSEGLKKPEFPRRILSQFSLFYPWRLLRSIRRRLRSLQF